MEWRSNDGAFCIWRRLFSQRRRETNQHVDNMFFSNPTSAIISSILALFLYLRAHAVTASINQALHPNRSLWKRLSSRDQCSDSCYNVLRLCNAVWSRRFGAGCVVEQWHWYFTHFKLFYFPIIIGLVQRTVRFVMRTEQKASYRMVQFEYAYRYTPNIYIYIYVCTSDSLSETCIRFLCVCVLVKPAPKLLWN